MADIELAFTFVMKNEDSTLSGKVTPEPDDAKARFGINSKAHPEAITDGFYEMSNDAALTYAKGIFVKWYWNPVMGDEIQNQLVANKFVDLAFNMNPPPATKIVQRAVNLSTGRIVVLVDGMMGPKTLQALNGLDPVPLLDSIKGYARQYYRDIAFRNPEEAKYLTAWLNRVDV